MIENHPGGRRLSCWCTGPAALAACVLGACGCASPQSAIAPVPPAPAARRVASARVSPRTMTFPSHKDPDRERLERIVIPSLEFRNEPIESVVETLIEKCREADPEGIGVNIILMPQGPAGNTDSSQPRNDAGVQDGGISMQLRRVTAYDALRAISRVGDLVSHVNDDAILLYARGTAPVRMETRVYSVHPSLLGAIWDRPDE